MFVDGFTLKGIGLGLGDFGKIRDLDSSPPNIGHLDGFLMRKCDNFVV